MLKFSHKNDQNTQTYYFQTQELSVNQHQNPVHISTNSYLRYQFSQVSGEINVSLPNHIHSSPVAMTTSSQS